MSFVSPPPARGPRAVEQVGRRDAGQLSLTPVIEELSNLRVTSTPRRPRLVSAEREESEEEKLPTAPVFEAAEEPDSEESKSRQPSRLEVLRAAYKQELGEGGTRAWELQRQPRQGPAP